MSKMDEPAIGRTYFRTMRRQGQVVEDPLLQEYIQNLGEKLSSKVQFKNQDSRSNNFLKNKSLSCEHSMLFENLRSETT